MVNFYFTIRLFYLLLKSLFIFFLKNKNILMFSKNTD